MPSQGGQDRRLARIFAKVGAGNRSFVEFGYTGRSTSNTAALGRQGWSGLLLDGNPPDALRKDARLNLHVAQITSRNIARLFRRHRVPTSVDYVSVDIDSFDLWVLRALLSSEFRPRVLTVEYNSNFPWGADLAFPDPQQQPVRPGFERWGGNCYMGSSASALDAVARAFGYVTVDVEPGLDLFLVRADVWGERAVPRLSAARVYRPFNVQLDGAMSRAQRAHYLSYGAWERTRDVGAARRRAAQTLLELERRGLPCVAGHRRGCLLQKCDALFSFLCVERDEPQPCRRYAGRPGWYIPQACWGGRAGPCNSTARFGAAATCAGRLDGQCGEVVPARLP